ncbi:hypothetical protein [Candidatus Uabimicrobium sp. HlEnr_7]|uniref:hypothetical protein n=1 Tax=Candidatus Uabimicrobium helgolandensis TaxID=3095367 RepID=UPI003555F45C
MFISPKGKYSCTVFISQGDQISEISDNKAGVISVSSKHITHSTAGMHWRRGTLEYFVSIDNRPHFVCFTGWGQRIMINLEMNALATVTNSTITSCLQKEQKIVLSYIKKYSKKIIPYDVITKPAAFPDLCAAIK